MTENPRQKIQRLQAIQDEIIAFIDANTTDLFNDELAYALRMAVSDLNQAKGIIGDRAVAAGTLVMQHHGRKQENK